MNKKFIVFLATVIFFSFMTGYVIADDTYNYNSFWSKNETTNILYPTENESIDLQNQSIYNANLSTILGDGLVWDSGDMNIDVIADNSSKWNYVVSENTLYPKVSNANTQINGSATFKEDVYINHSQLNFTSYDGIKNIININSNGHNWGIYAPTIGSMYFRDENDDSIFGFGGSLITMSRNTAMTNDYYMYWRNVNQRINSSNYDTLDIHALTYLNLHAPLVTVDGNMTLTGDSKINATENLTIGDDGDIILCRDIERDMKPFTDLMVNIGNETLRIKDIFMGGTFWANDSEIHSHALFGDGGNLTNISGTGNPFDQDLNTTNSPTFDNLTITGNINISGKSDDTYPFSLNVWNQDTASTYMGIFNEEGGQDQGAFFGLTSTVGNDVFGLYNWQGGDISFFTDEDVSDGTERMRIKNDGNTTIYRNLTVHTGNTNNYIKTSVVEFPVFGAMPSLQGSAFGGVIPIFTLENGLYITGTSIESPQLTFYGMGLANSAYIEYDNSTDAFSFNGQTGNTVFDTGINVSTYIGFDNEIKIGDITTTTLSTDTTTIGKGAVTEDFYALAMGWGARSTEQKAASFGYLSNASGRNSLSMGTEAFSGGLNSAAFGSFAKAWKTGSFGMGYRANASGYRSMCIGPVAASYGDYSGAFMYGAVSNGNYSLAMGPYSLTSHNYSVAIGTYAQTTAENQCQIGSETYPLNINASNNITANGIYKTTDGDGWSGYVDDGTNFNMTYSGGIVINVANSGGTAGYWEGL